MPAFLKALTIGMLLVVIPASVALAQDTGAKPVKLFKNNARMSVTLKGPWRRITRRVENPEKYPGELSYTDSSGQQQTLNIGITTRGLTRRDKVCNFPPLKLWFDKEQVKGTVFRGQGSLKMVTHCKDNKGFEQYYIKEYLSYRIYNLITPYSFRVRPLMVTYIDSERDPKPEEFFGFLIEDIDDVAKRNGLKELEIPKVSHRKLDPDEISNYALFQFLIANLDWSATGGRDPVECCHNTKLISESPDASTVFAIPYDLDSSGLVDTHYAAPPDKLPVRSIRQRLYRGFCVHNGAIPAALERFRAKKQDILNLFSSEDLLTEKGRASAVKFIEGFYNSLAKPGAVDKLLIDKCRG
jgi:hypothetical protein